MQGLASSAREKRIWVELVIEGVDERLADSIIAAIRPDNATAPGWMSISEHVSEKGLVLRVEVRDDGRLRVGSLRNTVTEIIEQVYALLKTIEETTKSLKKE